MNNKIVRISALFALMTSCAFAQQKDSITSKTDLKEVVISDSKFALPKEKSGKVIAKITQEQLKNSAGLSVATLLNTVSGIEINGNQNGSGKNLGLYIRGGKSNQILILIDGIPVTDASGISLEYDLRLLPVEQVESIEIMKGASSTLYGSGAATGVINITLKKATSNKMGADAYINLGTNNTAISKKTAAQDCNQGFSVHGTANKINYFASLNSTETGGMSQVKAPTADVNYEEDRFSRINYLGKVGFKATEKLTFDFFGNYDKMNVAYDGGFDATGTNDTKLNQSKSEQFRYGFMPKYKYQKGQFVLNSSFNKIVRTYDEFDSYSSSIGVSNYESRSVNVDGYNKYEFSKTIFLITGTQFQFHDMKSTTPYSSIAAENSKFNMIDPYFTTVYTSDFGLNLNFGARWNHHSQYGNQLVYNINPSYDFKSIPLKLLTSYSTAFVTPSLYQLYSEYGNLDLTPERNSTIEAGFECNLLNKKIKWNTVGFYRETTNFIGYITKYTNIDGTYKAKGIETEVTFEISKNLKWNANYTFTQVDEALDKLIPKHKVNAALDYHWNKGNVNLNYQYTDARNDIYYNGITYANQKAVLDSYRLVNFSIKQQIIKNSLSLFGAVTNILNEDFVENTGYSSRGRNFRLGLSLSL
jgi:vitamin B12 transporter